MTMLSDPALVTEAAGPVTGAETLSAGGRGRRDTGMAGLGALSVRAGVGHGQGGLQRRR